MSFPVKDLFANMAQYADCEICVSGWVRSLRAGGAFGFIELNDGSCVQNVQIVFEEKFLQNYKEITKVNVGAALTVSGTLALTPNAKQPFEIKAEEITIEGQSAPDYPLQKKRHGFEFLRKIAHLRPRTNTFGAVFRVRSAAAQAIHRFFFERGFLYIHTPIITSSDCEGAGETFGVTSLDIENLPYDDSGKVNFSQDFFGKRAGLTVSGQLNAECFALAFSKVYTFGPTFRAERSNTARHAAEFWMVEPEIAFASLKDNMRLAEDMTKYIVSFVLLHCYDDIAFFDKFIDTQLLLRLQNIAQSEFGRITYTEAVKLLKESNIDFEYPVNWGADLQTEHERYIAEKIFKKPVFVTDYPAEIKAFYMRLNDDGRTVAAMDLLVPGVGELIGGSAREERLYLLQERIESFNLDADDYKWYCDLRKYGGAPHAGFGLGFERLIMYLTGMGNIRDVCAFPRTFGSVEF